MTLLSHKSILLMTMLLIRVTKHDNQKPGCFRKFWYDFCGNVIIGTKCPNMYNANFISSINFLNMTLLENHKINSAFDILFKDAFGGMTNDYVPALNNKIHYPIDIYENDEGMKLEIACVGLEKKTQT